MKINSINRINFTLKDYGWLLLFSLLIKFIYFFVSKYSDPVDFFQFYFLHGDQQEYINYSENLFKYGIYGLSSKGEFTEFSSRMPGITFFYFPIRYFFNQHYTLNIIIIIQIFLTSLSSIYIFKILKIINANNITAIFGFLIYTMSLYTSAYDGDIMTESLASSFLVFSIYNYLRNNFLISGIFWVFIVFLRPYMIVIWIFLVLYNFFNKTTLNKTTFIFVSPLLFSLFLWTVRNYVKTEKLTVLQTSSSWIDRNENTRLRVAFIKKMGFRWVWWEETEHAWFMDNKFLSKNNIKCPDNKIFPDEIFNSKFTIDSLEKFKQLGILSNDLNFSELKRKNAEYESSKMMSRYLEEYERENWFEVNIYNRLKILYRFLNHPYGSATMSIKYPYNLLLRSFDFFMNYSIILIGLVSNLIFLLNFNRLDKRILIFILVSIFIIVLFPLYYRTDEDRFLFLAYTSFIVPIAYFLEKFIFIKKSRIIFFISFFSSFFIFSFIYNFVLYR